MVPITGVDGSEILEIALLCFSAEKRRKWKLKM